MGLFLAGFLATPVDKTNAATVAGVGALAWIEPSSRTITIGLANVMEGARILKLFVKEGQVVKKGDVLGLFSTHSVNQAELEIATARLALAVAHHNRAKAGSKNSDIKAQESRIQSLRFQEKNAEIEYTRARKLLKAEALPQSKYDAIKSSWESLNAERKASEAGLKSLLLSQGDDIAITEAEIKVAEAEKLRAEKKLELSTVIAPIDGTILKIHVFEGEAVGSPGVMDIADLSSFDAVAEVYEQDILRVREGQKADIIVPGMEMPLKGSVSQVGWQVNRNLLLEPNPNKTLDTRVIETRIRIDPAFTESLKRLINMKVKAVIYP